MKKAIWKKTIAAGAVLMSLGVVCPVASLHAEEAEAPYEEVMEASDGEVNPCADQIGYIYIESIMEGYRNAVGIILKENG